MSIAVVGYGNMGRNHYRVLREMGHEPLIVEPDLMRHPDQVSCFDTIDNLLRGEIVDAVIVASPTETHYANAMTALEAGCAVLVEKPMTADLGDAASLLGTAESRGLVLECGLVERWNPAVRALEAEIGDKHVRVMSSRRSGPASPVVGQGVTAELATHDIDVMNWLMRSTPVSVAGAGDGLVVEAILRYEGGPIGSVSADTLSPRKVRELRVLCDEGTYDLDYIEQRLSWQPIGGSRIEIEVPRTEPLRAELEHFLGRVEHRSASARTAEAALAAMQVVAYLTGEAP